MWTTQQQISNGAYIMATVTSGWNIDLFASVTEPEVLQRVGERARGWQPVSVQWERGLLGVGSTLRVYGQALTVNPAASIQADVEAGLNSFWTIGGVSAVIQTSDTLEQPPTAIEQWRSTLQIVAVAVIVVGVVWGITQVRKAFQ